MQSRSEPFDDVLLNWVPISLASAGPRVCLASLSDHRRGILTGEWLPLSLSLPELQRRVEALRCRVVSDEPSLGIFDLEGLGVNDLRPPLSLAALTNGRQAATAILER